MTALTQSAKNKNLLGQYLVLALLFSAGFFGYVMHSVDWFHAIPGDLVDARFNSVILEHLFQWVEGRTLNVWSPTFFYPFQNVLAFSDNHFGSAWSYILFRLSGLPRESAFLGWFIVGNLLNFWVAYYALRRLGFSVAASGAGAFVFAFSLPALAKESHAQLMYRFAVPLAFVSLFNFFQTKRLALFSQSMFWLAVQFYCSIYLGIFLVYLLLALTISMVLCQHRNIFHGWWSSFGAQPIRRHLASLLMLLFSFAAIGWLLFHYQSTSAFYGFSRKPDEILSILPKPSSYLLADSSPLSRWVGQLVPKSPMRHEQQLFFGIGVSLLGIIGAWHAWFGHTQKAVIRIASLTLLLLIVLTISIDGYSAYRWLLTLPGISSIRAVSRVVLVMLFPLGILVATCFEHVNLDIKIQWMRFVMLLVMVGILVVETIGYQPYRTPLTEWAKRQITLKSLLPAKLAQDAVIYVTNTRADRENDLVEVDGMILAQDLGMPTLNGYSGNITPGYIRPDPCVSYQHRLNQYFDLNHDSRSQLTPKELSGRVVVISPEVCEQLPVLPTDIVIDVNLVKGIHLTATGTLSGHYLDAKVSVENETGVRFSTLSKKGPIRLSWRFVPLMQSKQASNMPGWDSRKELFFTIEPGQTWIEPLVIDLPTRPGRYILEFSLVQDGVAWFHELGMPPAQMELDVP